MTIALTPATTIGRSGLRQAVQAEWIKLVSLRSTKWMLAVAGPGTLLVTWLATRGAAHHPRQWYQGFDPTNQALAGLFLASLVFGVFGVLAITGEYGTGTVRASVAAVPRREVLLAAKVIVVGGVTLVVGEILSFLAFFVGQAILSGGSAPTATLGQPGVARAVLLSGAFLSLLALFGLGLGTAIRHTAGGLAAYAGCTLLSVIVLERISQWAAELAPEAILANSVAAVVPQGEAQSATIGFVLMSGYCLAALGLGAALLLRRDA